MLLFLLIWLSAARVGRLFGHYQNGSFGEPGGLVWQIGAGIGFGILHAWLAWALAGALNLVMNKSAWAYRLAFLTSSGWAVASWLPFLVGKPGLGRGYLIIVVMSVIGAFTGGLLATTRSTGFFENNLPPTEWLQTELLEKHRMVIGLTEATPVTKRMFDICLAVAGLLFFLPVWLASAFLIWFENPGPLLFVKNSVGKGGLNFRQYKFRTMVYGAESQTGPVLASERDDRALWIGRLLRKTALDELPQLLNILAGEMSFAGPRPQRSVLVYGYLEAMPEYAERHRVVPGLAGLAQVAGDYYLTPRQKLRFDRLYIQKASFGFDLKLLLLATLIAFWFRWRRDWNGRLPRWMLHSPLPVKSLLFRKKPFIH